MTPSVTCKAFLLASASALIVGCNGPGAGPEGMPVVMPQVYLTQQWTRLTPGQTFSTNDVIKLVIRSKDPSTSQQRDYSALVGKNPFGSTLAANGSVNAGEDGVQLMHGWIYLTGMMPNVSTGIATIAADGSEFVVEAYQAGGREWNRVILIDKHDGTRVRITRGTSTFDLTTNGHYVDFEASSTISASATIPSTGDLRNLAEHAKAMARIAALP